MVCVFLKENKIKLIFINIRREFTCLNVVACITRKSIYNICLAFVQSRRKIFVIIIKFPCFLNLFIVKK